ncbi:MAG TPA: hypothetical protein VJG64_01825 [Candidatus Paceibacterota bacterium]
MITKKNVFLATSGYLATSIGIIVFLKYILGCPWRGECVDLGWSGDLIFALFFLPMPIFLITFVFSLLTYNLHDAVFIAWRKFALWAVPVLMILTYILTIPPRTGGLGIGSVIAASFTLATLFLLFASFVIISLVIIVWKYFSTRSK